MQEIWKDIDGYIGIYQVSNAGRFRSVSRVIHRNNGTLLSLEGRLISTFVHCKTNYLVVALRKNNIRKYYLTHRLVAKSFIPNPENKPEVNHLDFNTHNNHADNLEWSTSFENIHHSIKNGRSKYASGENAGHSKLKNNQIELIFNLYKSGISQYKIASQFNMNQSAINRILNGKTYKNISKGKAEMQYAGMNQ